MTNTTTTPKPDIWEKRSQLKAISATAALLVKMGRFATINDAIISLYTTDEHREFNTYKQWKEKGYQVRKGETAFLVWARPLEVQAEQEQPTSEGRGKFFPVCFLFSNAQVDPIS